MAIIAAAQMCSSHKLDENLETAAALIKEAATHGARLIVLPEMFAMMSRVPQDIFSIQEIFGAGKIQAFLSTQAIKNNIWIAGGTIPITDKSSRKTNAACILYDAQGKVVGRYDKIHLFDAILSEKETYKESDTIQAGNHLCQLDTPVGKTGLAVCYDIRFPELFRALFNSGTDVFLIPTAFTYTTGQAHWHVLVRSRAIENFSYIVAACQGGSHTNGRQTYGHSLIVDPWGKIVSELSEDEQGLVYADLDLDYLREVRRSMPVKEHQRIFTKPFE